MKWWVYLIIAIVLLSGGFWLYMFIGAKRDKDSELAKARQAKEDKAKAKASAAENEIIVDAEIVK